MKDKLLVLLAIAVVALAVGTSNAADPNDYVYQWDGDTDNDWHTASNWTFDQAPAEDKNLAIFSGTPVATANVNVQGGSTVLINGGDVSWSGSFNAIANTENEAGTLVINSGSLTAANGFYIGNASGANGMVQQNCGIVSTLDATLSIAKEGAAYCSGTYEISGGTLNVGQLSNGVGGIATLHIIGDAAEIITSGVIGINYWQNYRSTLKLTIADGISMIDASSGIVGLSSHATDGRSAKLEVEFSVTPEVGDTFPIIEYGILQAGSAVFGIFDTLVDSPLGKNSVRLAIDYNVDNKIVLTVTEIVSPNVWNGPAGGEWGDVANWDTDQTALAPNQHYVISSGTPAWNTWSTTYNGRSVNYIEDGGYVHINGGDVTWNTTLNYIGRGRFDIVTPLATLLITSGSLTSGANTAVSTTTTYPTFNIGDRSPGLVQLLGGLFELVSPGDKLSISGGGGGGTLEISGGQLITSGRLQNGWDDGGGTVHIIGDAATIDVDSYFQKKSTLKLDIGSGISMIDAASSVTLDVESILEVEFTEIPTIGQTFDIISYGTTLSGTFATFDTLVYSPLGKDTVELSINYNSSNKVVLTVVYAPVGVNVISPLNNAETYGIDIPLQWENIPTGGNINVWFGTEPNNLTGSSDYTKVVNDAPNTTIEKVVEDLVPGIYYWQVDTMLNGELSEGPLYKFYHLGVIESLELVADGEVTWLDQEVTLAAIVENPGGLDLVYDWSYVDPGDTDITVTLVANNSNATLTVVDSTPSGQVINIPVQVSVTVVGETMDPIVSNTVNIEVHDTACLAARNGLGLSRETDLDGDCIIGLGDFAELAADWLVDYELKGPASK